MLIKSSFFRISKGNWR